LKNPPYAETPTNNKLNAIKPNTPACLCSLVMDLMSIVNREPVRNSSVANKSSQGMASKNSDSGVLRRRYAPTAPPTKLNETVNSSSCLFFKISSRKPTAPLMYPAHAA
ncbi:hypothetical protein D030_4316B, partial [Vibrio parahaemolyticus AQ3810]